MKKLQFISLILLISLLSCTSIDVAYTNKQTIQKRMKRVAVLPFKIAGADWGNEFADAIPHQFFKSGKVTVLIHLFSKLLILKMERFF